MYARALRVDDLDGYNSVRYRLVKCVEDPARDGDVESLIGLYRVEGGLNHHLPSSVDRTDRGRGEDEHENGRNNRRAAQAPGLYSDRKGLRLIAFGSSAHLTAAHHVLPSS